MKINIPKIKIRKNSNTYYLSKYKKRRLFIGAAGILILMLIICLIAMPSDKSNDIKTSVSPASTPKPAPNIPPASVENNLLNIAVNPQTEEGKFCYLTFDDGPTEKVTPKVLDVLKEYNVKATFFMLGRMIEQSPDIAKRAYEEGHLLANHSYSHEYKNLYESGDSFMEEINKTISLISDISGGYSFKLVRFPGGGNTNGEYGEKKQEYKKLLQENGYYYADWNALNGDAEAVNNSTERLLQRVKNTAINNNIVVLMHDASTKSTTAESLPSIIEYLKEQGYEFKRLDEVDYYEKNEKSQNNSMIM